MFLTVFRLVAIMMFYMSIGFALCKSRLADPSHARSMSGLLVYILGPAMIINSFVTTDFTSQVLAEIGIFFLASLVTQTLFLALLYLILHKKYDDAKIRVMSAAAVFGNVGFFGLPLITGIFPNEPIVACYSSIYVMSMNLLSFTIGTFLITNNKKYMSLRSAILNPTTIAILISMPLFVLSIKLPETIGNSVSLLAKMVTPMCMIILGMRLSTVKIRELVSKPTIYASCALKLIIYPIFAYTCVRFVPFFSDTFKVTILILSATPSAAVISSLAELCGCEQEQCANSVLLATILSVITLPVLAGFFM